MALIDTQYLLALLQTPKIGKRSVQYTIASTREPMRDLKDLLAAVENASEQNSRITVPSDEELERGYQSAIRILERAEALQLHALGYYDGAFPDKLKKMPDAPVLLYVRGSVDALQSSPAVAVIGTRKPTEYGSKVAERFGAVLAEKGAVVVAGLALGCDTAAHKGCVDVGGKTVAFMAHGLDIVYPKENEALAEQIIAAGGCLASEYPPGASVQRNTFVERDRLQAGLSDAVIVIETDIKGGTMHTVRFAQEQGKILACLKHPKQYLENPATQGNQTLLREEKAAAIADKEDLELFWKRILAAQPEKKREKKEQKKRPPTQQTLF